MRSSFGSIIALLFGTAYLLSASGLHALLLPLRGQFEGFSTTSLGLLGTSWAGGFIAGCYLAPRLVRRVGHVRAFGALAASAATIALLTGMFVEIKTWIVLRAFTGFAMAGAYMVIESWLNERSTNTTRGTIFALYMIVTNLALMLGQMALLFGDITTPKLFMLTGILFCLSLLPTALSKAASPAPLASVSLDLKALYTNSPISVAACLLIGIANGAWGTLGAVYGAEIGIPTFYIALMMSAAVLAGAVGQFPIGKISDFTDRRYVLVGASLTTALIGFIIFVAAPRTPAIILIMVALYGVLAYTLYSVAVAHANDHASPGKFVQVSSGLLMLYGIGTMIGPLIAGYLMQLLRPESLFLVTASAHLAVAGYAALRISRRAPVPVEEKDAFTTQPAERSATPQTILLNPRTEIDEESETSAGEKTEEVPAESR